jgi:hypothetical protein
MLFYCGLVTFVVCNQNFHGNNENYCTSIWLCLCLPYTLQDYVVPYDLFTIWKSYCLPPFFAIWLL